MEALSIYLIKMVGISGLLTAYYFVALRNRRLNGFNRYYLLAMVGISVILPLIRINWVVAEPLSRVFAGDGTGGAAREDLVYRYSRFLPGVCSLISAGLLVLLALKVGRVFRLKKSCSCRQMEDYVLIETEEPGTPFSFFANLFWKRGMDMGDPLNKKMLAHELAHIRGRHTRDILFVQTAASLFWMNPFFWFIRRELAMVHEFIADAASGTDGDAEGFARMLLQVHNEGRYLDLSHGFFHSPIKRRLVMITNNNRPDRAWLRKALALPFLMILVVLFSCQKQQQPTKDASDVLKIKLDRFQHQMVADGKIIRYRVVSDGKSLDDVKLDAKRQSDSLMRVYIISDGRGGGDR
jgi:hypothetical protein